MSHDETKTNRAGANRYEGGDLLVQSLLAHGVREVFSVSGGPLNSIYHACAAHGLPLRHTRHEAAACFMAEAVGRVTGTPGVAALTLGPGVTNGVTPALVSKMASTPLLIVGAQAKTASFDRGAGMSADHIPIMAPVTKWAARVLQTDRIPEYVQIAWRKMWAGSPGPVFLEIPVDILSARAEPQRIMAARPERPGFDHSQLGPLRTAVARAKRPIVLIGNDVRWDAPAQLLAVIERNGLPFSTMRLARGAVDEHHQLWAGPGYLPCNATLRKVLAEADLILLLGHSCEFDLDFGTGVARNATVVQCVMDAELLGRNRRADIGFTCAPSAFIDALAEMAFESVAREWVESVVHSWEREWKSQPGGTEGQGLHPAKAVDAIADAMPDGTVYVTSHGNVDFWADARLKIRRPDLYLRAGQAGALGAEIPYGIGAKFANPERPVVVFIGDGGVGYHITELDTAARYERPVIIVVLDDAKWGAIALPQRQAYGAEYEMELPRRDWAKVAQGLGCFGRIAETPGEIGKAVSEALASGKPALIQVPVASVLSPYMAYISK
ncbi:MAG TPA: thiamine pyrophosphate-binding protein [Hyphomicrobiales bacterium]|nr:thiamine pyrophosphate-binding protein [Hyphomicrobiales bacterium]